VLPNPVGSMGQGGQAIQNPVAAPNAILAPISQVAHLLVPVALAIQIQNNLTETSQIWTLTTWNTNLLGAMPAQGPFLQ
jgi:hypothetical protein